MEPWAIWVDIEGFSRMYPIRSGRALRLLGVLMEGIYLVGNTACADQPNSIWAYQTGDGFIISSSFGLGAPQLPLGIGIFLLRTLTLAGGCGKCAISTGDMGDVQGCYPKVIQDNATKGGYVHLGFGLMTTFPVMGTALINAHSLSGKEHGSLLLWDSKLPLDGAEVVVHAGEEPGHLLIDWVHSKNDYAEQFLSASGADGSAERVESLLKAYLERESLPQDWRTGTTKYNNLRVDKS